MSFSVICHSGVQVIRFKGDLDALQVESTFGGVLHILGAAPTYSWPSSLCKGTAAVRLCGLQ